MGWPLPLSPVARTPQRDCGEKLGERAPACKRLAVVARYGPCLLRAFLVASKRGSRRRYAMTPFFVQIKCQLGKSYEVANRLADAEIASEIYSTAGDYDLLVKFYVDDGTDIGHFINEKVQTIPGIHMTHTIITFKAF
jgi:DNA-binding Lrp family transcriptional regulator